MTHVDVLEWFERYFPHYGGKNISEWFPNGKDSIRVRQTNGAEFIFTYHKQDNWRFETVDSFLGKEKNNG